jgi:VWFA-related protein
MNRKQRDLLLPFQRRHLAVLRAPMLVAACVAIVLPLPGQQNPSETLKVQAVDVVVDVIVTDKNGRHVPGLTAQDFTVMEDGVTQRIVSFSEARVAGPNMAGAPASDTKPPDTASVPTTPAQRPHLLTVVMDLSDTRPQNLRKSGDAVLKYLEKELSPNDYVAIYYIDRALRLALPFTNDLEQARAAVTKLGSTTAASSMSSSDRSLVQNQINELYARIHPEAAVGLAGEAIPSRDNPQVPLLQRELQTLRTYLTTQNTLQAKAVFVALRAICTSYRDLPGRKNVVLFSEGFLYADDARPQMEAVADAANRSNVALYVIDPVGLEIGGGGVLAQGSDTLTSQMMDIASQGPAAVGQAHGVTKFDNMRNLGESTRNQQLEWLADVTGGLMVKNTNDLGPAFARAVDDARDFYSISYQPANKELDGRFRRIKLALAQRGYQLRYRQGYWAIPHSQAVSVTPAAAQMLANTKSSGYRPAFEPDLYANLLLAPDGQFVAPVSVSFPGGKVPLEKAGENFRSSVTLVLVARDAQGTILGTSQRDWPFLFNQKNKDEFIAKTVTLQTDLSVSKLAPITLEAIVSLPGGVLASSETDLGVKDRRDSGPKLSGVLLTNRAEQAVCPDNTDPLCLENVRLIQPAKPQFAANSRLIVYFAANELALDAQMQKPRIGVDMRLKAGGTLLKSPAAENVQALTGPLPGSVMVLAEFDLRSLGQGNYTVHVTARDLVKKTSAQSEAEFAVQ